MLFNVGDISKEDKEQVIKFLNENNIKYTEESSGFMACLSELAYDELQMYENDNNIQDEKFIENNLKLIKDALFESDDNGMDIINYENIHSIIDKYKDQLKIK